MQPGAIPGKSLKRKTTESDDKREKTKKYEENRKACKGVGMIRVDFDPISETVFKDIILNTIIER